MNIHEYQAKAILSEFGINTTDGVVITTKDEVESACTGLGTEKVAVKAQVHLGGRKKAGGVKFATSLDEVKQYASDMLGKILKTYQSGSSTGMPVNKVYIEPMAQIEQEYYVALLVDSEKKLPTFVVSKSGGGDIEDIAKNHPESIFKLAIDPVFGMQPFHGRLLSTQLGLTGDLFKQGVYLFSRLYQAYQRYDTTLLEINPLVVTSDRELLALDGKMVIDDNALFRQSRIAGMRDISQEEAGEVQAREHDLNYVKLDGNIGCVVNGAGLAMATMDIIKLHGAAPANFLDVGGSATQERVEKAFELLMGDSNVQGILINIFGGIVHCDMIARGIIEATKKIGINVPMVVRLEGTNAQQGLDILGASDIDVLTATSLEDATLQITKAVKTTIKQHGS